MDKGEWEFQLEKRDVSYLNDVPLSAAGKSHLAAEALAGLASTEDFKSMALKSAAIPIIQSWLPYKPVMLIHIKGRTHVQVRLVEPLFSSINRGDCYLLVTKHKLFRFVGEFANVIE